MADANLSPIQILQKIVAQSINGNAKDDEITLGEVRRAIDTDGDEFISNEELNQAIKDASNLNLSAGPDRAQLEQAQKLLKQLIDNPKLREKPPQPVTRNGLVDAPLIRNPHELSDSNARTRWSNMRSGFAGQVVNVNLNAERENIRQILGKNNGNVGALVRELWTSPDSIGGQATHVVRMSELIGAWKYFENKPDLRGQFIQEMAAYITDPKNGLDQQFVLDSLLQVIQSTEFDGEQKDLRKFLEELAIGIASSENFAGNKGDGVVGNYDGTRENGVFGSLALVRKADGSLEFVVHDPAVPGQKTVVVPSPLRAPARR